MGIEVQLRDESGNILAEVPDVQMTLARAAHGTLSETRLLRYLMTHGDAVFNQAQAGDLGDDLRQIASSHPGTPLADLIARIGPLVDRLSSEVHVYLWFVGD